MKLIIAIIQPEELPAVKEELLKRNIYKFTITNARGQGKEIPVQEVYRGISHEITLLKKVRLEVAVNDEFVDAVVEAVTSEVPPVAIKSSTIITLSLGLIESLWISNVASPYSNLKSTEYFSAGNLFFFLIKIFGFDKLYERGEENIKPRDSIPAILSQLTLFIIFDI